MRYLYLHIILLLQVFSGICLKFASGNNFLSITFILLYALGIFFLILYAFFWQKILKLMPLSTAYMNVSMVIIWMIFVGYLIWGEPITINKIIGALFVITGIIIINKR